MIKFVQYEYAWMPTRATGLLMAMGFAESHAIRGYRLLCSVNRVFKMHYTMVSDPNGLRAQSYEGLFLIIQSRC